MTIINVFLAKITYIARVEIPRSFALFVAKKKKIIEQCLSMIAGLEQQTKSNKKTLDSLDNNHPSIDKGSTVGVPIPEVDRDRGDLRSILELFLMFKICFMFQLSIVRLTFKGD